MQNLRAAPLGYQQITASSSAQGLTVPTGATMMVISVETANIRWRDDGVPPTASVGMPIAAGAAPYEYFGTLSAFQIIAQTGSPVVNIAYYRISG
jgi:hypothetical protein